ncbi:helix-hairpin-helix domain-containing protein [Planococcus sp. MERTA32b]|nr:helix-hairpin-helix domain-containing protein [Planococcus sp. MER TA 32b]
MGENDFPKGVGKPATRALIEAGYTKVEQLKDATEKEILELHGVGPKAIKVLKQELASKGLEFKK